jgi:hypothetical protein
MQERELSRSDEQARTRRKAGPQAAVSSQHCANAYSDATCDNVAYLDLLNLPPTVIGNTEVIAWAGYALHSAY